MADNDRSRHVVDRWSRFCCRSSGGGRRDRRASAWRRTSPRSRSACRMIQGAPLQYWFAGRAPIGNETADGGRADCEGRGGLIERCLAALGALAVTVDGDVILMAQRADPPPCPAIAVTGRLAGSVEHCRNGLVRHL